MRVRMLITLPSDLLKGIDRTRMSRSVFIERASRSYLARIEKLKQERRDVRIINIHADHLNKEAGDVLKYQRLP